MFFRNYIQVINCSSLVLLISVFAVSIYGQNKATSQSQVKPCNLSTQGQGFADRGSGTGNGLAIDPPYDSKISIEDKPKIHSAGTKPLQIFSKPVAKYTIEARNNCIQGTVVLKITFFANGKVGKFKVLNGLEFGLSQQAIEAAKLINFEPALKNGKPISVTKKVKYNFTIY